MARDLDEKVDAGELTATEARAKLMDELLGAPTVVDVQEVLVDSVTREEEDDTDA